MKEKISKQISRLIPADELHRAHSKNQWDVLTWLADNEALYKRFYNPVFLPATKSCGLVIRENNTIRSAGPSV